MKTKYHTTRTALLDADYLAYTCAAWAHDHQADTQDLVDRVESRLEGWKKQACCTSMIALFSCPREECFRRDHYALYKSDRIQDKPPGMRVAKQVIKDYADQDLQMEGLEADDLMGILATNGKVLNPVMITRDKDLRQVPGWHFNPWEDDFPVYVDEIMAEWRFMMQWLHGDRADHFKGCKGIGEARAKKILNGSDDWESTIIETYHEKGHDLDYCLSMAICARILQHGDWNEAMKKPIPWIPKQIGYARHLWDTSKNA